MTTATAAAPLIAETLTLVDLSGIFHAAWHASANDNVSTAFETTLSTVRRIAAKHERIAICCDSGKSWRKDVYPEYKANRPPADATLIAELRRAQERLKADGYLVWSVPEYEADDLIATAVRQAASDSRIGHVVIASADKDLLQLVCSGVSCLSTRTWDELTPKEVTAKFGVGPDRLLQWLALVGDSSDNIPGVKGIGPKRATELLTKYGDHAGIYRAALDEASDITPAIRAALLDSDAAVALAIKLITLRADAPIEVAEVFAERKPAPLAQEDPDVSELDGGTMVDEPAPEDNISGPPPANDPTPATTAVATTSAPMLSVVPVSYERGLEPTGLGAAYKLATHLFNSRLYSRFPSEQAIFAVIIRGREMGLGALTSLDLFHLVEGKPCPHAHLIIARAMEHPDCESFQCVETTDTSATYVTKNRRNKTPTTLTYTIQQAQNAGLISPKGPNWTKRPAEMLRKTCGAQLARMEYPGAAMGLYSVAEMGGDE